MREKEKRNWDDFRIIRMTQMKEKEGKKDKEKPRGHSGGPGPIL